MRHPSECVSPPLKARDRKKRLHVSISAALRDLIWSLDFACGIANPAGSLLSAAAGGSSNAVLKFARIEESRDRVESEGLAKRRR